MIFKQLEDTVKCKFKMSFTFLQYILIKKKIKFSSYIRKFRRDRWQSNIWLTASWYMVKYLRISSYIRKPFLIYVWLCNWSHLNFLIDEENFVFFFISVVELDPPCLQCGRLPAVGSHSPHPGDEQLKYIVHTLESRFPSFFSFVELFFSFSIKKNSLFLLHKYLKTFFSALHNQSHSDSPLLPHLNPPSHLLLSLPFPLSPILSLPLVPFSFLPPPPPFPHYSPHHPYSYLTCRRNNSKKRTSPTSALFLWWG